MPSVDICLVSGCRPGLLAQTLESFHDKLINRLSVARCLANIDLFGGGEADRQKCVQLVLQYFPQAEIFQPTRPNFAAAVQRIWQATSAPHVLHLEDDWVLLESIDPIQTLALLNEETRALKFLSREHHWNPKQNGCFDVGSIRRKFLSITVSRESYNRHGTSPGLFDGEFVRTWAKLMDIHMDPEKQVRPGMNQPLFEYARQFRCRFLPGQNNAELIRDIGRAWRDQQGISKRLKNGQTVWESDSN